VRADLLGALTYSAQVSATRPATDYTARIVPRYLNASVPLEASRLYATLMASLESWNERGKSRVPQVVVPASSKRRINHQSLIERAQVGRLALSTSMRVCARAVACAAIGADLNGKTDVVR